MDKYFNFLIAVGTVSVAIMAIWGEWVRSKLAPPKLQLEAHNLRGTVTRFGNGQRVIYYHLLVRNLRTWMTVRNCRVILQQVHRRGPDGLFHLVPLPVPLQFVWAPGEFSPILQTIHNHAILDFGLIIEGAQFFRPALYVTSNDFRGFAEAGEAVRYSLEITADNYSTSIYQVFEVAWNGSWSDNLDEMSNNLTIREIESEVV